MLNLVFLYLAYRVVLWGDKVDEEYALPPNRVALVVLAASACQVLVLWTTITVFKLLGTAWQAAQTRASRVTPVGAMIVALLDLLDKLEYEPNRLRPHSRATCDDLIEQVAAAVPHALTVGAPSDTPRSRSDAAADELHAARIAAAIRDLKGPLRAPKPDSWTQLHKTAKDMLVSVVNGHWGNLPSRTPDPVSRVLLRRAVLMVRGLAVVVVPPLALAVYQTIAVRECSRFRSRSPWSSTWGGRF